MSHPSENVNSLSMAGRREHLVFASVRGVSHFTHSKKNHSKGNEYKNLFCLFIQTAAPNLPPTSNRTNFWRQAWFILNIYHSLSDWYCGDVQFFTITTSTSSLCLYRRREMWTGLGQQFGKFIFLRSYFNLNESCLELFRLLLRETLNRFAIKHIQDANS